MRVHASYQLMVSITMAGHQNDQITSDSDELAAVNCVIHLLMR